MYHTMLVSLDGSLAAEAALWEVEKLLKIAPAKVVLLRVRPTLDLEETVAQMAPNLLGSDSVVADEMALLSHAAEAEIREYLEAVANRLEQDGGETVVEVGVDNPIREILHFARYYQADLIVMATHGRSGLAHLRYGSVTEGVLHHAPCPVLAVRVPQAVDALAQGPFASKELTTAQAVHQF